MLDHLVVAAATLADGVAWCEATLGVTPGPGGEHPLFGTHNRLFRIASPGFPDAYFEIIAINPAATPSRPGRRWFDLDDKALQARLRRDGPQLIHWVARTPSLASILAEWRAAGVDRGEVLHASRPTPQGLLEWQITVRPDGQRLMQGCLPTLIQWGSAHPARTMLPSGVTLESLVLSTPPSTWPDAIAAQLNGGSQAISVRDGAWQLAATLSTPNGLVTLNSGGV
jgi:hypothetical protein